MVSWNATLERATSIRPAHRAQNYVSKGWHVQEGHEPRNEPVSGPFDDPQERSHEWPANDRRQRPSFERVSDEQLYSALIEAMFLLEHECLIVLEWERRDASEQ